VNNSAVLLYLQAFNSRKLQMNKQGVIFMVVEKYRKQHNVSNTRQKAPFWVHSLSVLVTLNINFKYNI